MRGSRSGMVRQHQTRNLEIPGSMLSHRPGMTVVERLTIGPSASSPRGNAAALPRWRICPRHRASKTGVDPAADADAFRSIGLDRRAALWRCGVADDIPLPLSKPPPRASSRMSRPAAAIDAAVGACGGGL